MEATTAAAPLPATPLQASQPDQDGIARSRAQIDRITYLASLASRFEDIDPLMDTLRGVTATWDSAQPLQPAELQKLQTLESELKTYLITKDPVRAFTAESLEQKLEERAARGGKHKATYLNIPAVLGPAVLAAGIPFLFPASWLSDEARILVAIPLFFVALHIGISWLFLSALKNFQQEVRRAFQILCIGVMLFGVTFSHYAIIAAFQLDTKYAFLEDGGVSWLVALPFIFIFFGLRIYARQVQVKSRVLSLWFVFAVAAVVVASDVLFKLLFEGRIDSALFFLLAIGGMMLHVSSALGAVLAWKIRKVVAAAYARPMTWLFAYLLFSFVASVYSALSVRFGGTEGTMPFYILMAVAGIPVQLVLMWTGYVFKRELSK